MAPTSLHRNTAIIFASRNASKLQEVSAILPHSTIYSPDDMGITCTPEENGTSFLENALIKAKEYYRAFHNRDENILAHVDVSQKDVLILSEDSGLCVEALQDSPGIYSARYGYTSDVGSHTHPQENNEYDECIRDTAHPLYQCHVVLNEMKNISNRKAKFVCCAVLMWNLNDFLISQSEWHGEIIKGTPTGTHGFGYDPIFYLPDHTCTSAELLPEEKNKISHRKLAISRFKDILYISH